MNDLERYFRDNTGRQIHKWHHYFEIYERHLARFRGTDVHGVYLCEDLHTSYWPNYKGG